MWERSDLLVKLRPEGSQLEWWARQAGGKVASGGGLSTLTPSPQKRMVPALSEAGGSLLTMTVRFQAAGVSLVGERSEPPLKLLP